MDSPTIIRAFNSSRAKSSLPKHELSSPGGKKEEKNTNTKKKRLLTFPEERGGEKEQAGRKAKQVGVNRVSGRVREKKTNEKGQGAKEL